MGIETVKLEGKGFDLAVNVGDKVKRLPNRHSSSKYLGLNYRNRYYHFQEIRLMLLTLVLTA